MGSTKISGSTFFDHMKYFHFFGFIQSLCIFTILNLMFKSNLEKVTCDQLIFKPNLNDSMGEIRVVQIFQVSIRPAHLRDAVRSEAARRLIRITRLIGQIL